MVYLSDCQGLWQGLVRPVDLEAFHLEACQEHHPDLEEEADLAQYPPGSGHLSLALVQRRALLLSSLLRAFRHPHHKDEDSHHQGLVGGDGFERWEIYKT